MTDDNYVSTDDNMSVLTTNTHTDDIMTEEVQMRTIGKPKADKDPNALKLASFRTKEGIWAEFCQKAESINLTATDVLKAAMDQFISGEYDPRVYVPSRHHDSGMTRNDVTDIVNDVIGETLAKLDPWNAKALETAIERLSIPNYVAVRTMIGEEITKLESPGADISEQIKAQVEPLADLITELEAYTRSQIDTLRTELKKPLAIALPTTTPTKTAPNRTKPEGEPDWVKPNNRRYYAKLVNDSDLLAKVTNSIELHPTDNNALAESLVILGFHKGDGAALDSASVSRIKGVVKNLDKVVEEN